MLLDQEIKRIREAKNRLGIRCDLHRHLVRIEVQSIWFGARRTLSNLTLGLTVIEHVFNFLRERKSSRD